MNEPRREHLRILTPAGPVNPRRPVAGGWLASCACGWQAAEPCANKGAAKRAYTEHRFLPMVEISAERWLPFPFAPYSAVYEVSDLGRVRSLRWHVNGGIMRQRPNVHGYLVVDLCLNYVKKTFPVHQAVAAAFIDMRPAGEEVRHRDGDQANNHAVNLIYGSSSANKFDSVEHGTHANAAKTHCPQDHEYTPENTYRYPGRPNNRICRTCESDRRAARRAALCRRNIASS
jgi:hypothetical protein